MNIILLIVHDICLSNGIPFIIGPIQTNNNLNLIVNENDREEKEKRNGRKNYVTSCIHTDYIFKEGGGVDCQLKCFRSEREQIEK